MSRKVNIACNICYKHCLLRANALPQSIAHSHSDLPVFVLMMLNLSNACKTSQASLARSAIA